MVEDMSGMMTLLRSSRKPRIVYHFVRRKERKPIFSPVEPQSQGECIDQFVVREKSRSFLRSSRKPRIVHHSVRRKSEAEDLGGGEEDEKCLRIVRKDEVAQRVYLYAADDA